MKKIAPILILLTLLFSCSSPEKKAKKAIKEYLKYTLNDFKSYEPISYGKIEIANSSWEDLPEVKLYLDKAEVLKAKSKEYSDKADIYNFDYSSHEWQEYNNLSRDYMVSARYYIDKVDSIKLHFVSHIIGWKMQHSFRARIPAGGYRLTTYVFYFDQDYSQVVKSVDLSDL